MSSGFRCFASLALAGMLWIAGAGAHAFTLTDTKGKVHRLQDYRGKWVLVNFWATWCPPCLEEIPDLIRLYEKRANKDLMVIGVAMDYQSPATVLQFAEQMFISYPVVLGDKASAAQIGKITALPTTFLYGPDGKLAATTVGPVTPDAIERFMDEHAPKTKGKRAGPARATPAQMVLPLYDQLPRQAVSTRLGYSGSPRLPL
jgi:thiol-disulfide isomerase/thioredoxin